MEGLTINEAALGGSTAPAGLTINEAALGGSTAPAGLTINEAAATTGWSPRMLRYVERSGLIAPERTASGYRVYGPAELQRLRTLKELLAQFDLGLSDVAFAARLNTDPVLRSAVQAWLETRPERPRDVEPSDWLSFEQAKHERLLAVA